MAVIRPKILLLGTFHMRPAADMFRTDAGNMLSPSGSRRFWKSSIESKLLNRTIYTVSNEKDAPNSASFLHYG